MARTMVKPTTEDQTRTPASPTSVVSLSRPTKRHPSWVLIGTLLVGLAALLGAWVFAASSDRISVVVAAIDLGPGDVIDATDLRVVEIAASSDLRAIQSNQQDLIVGKAARGPIPAGTVLNTDLFTDQGEAVPAGMAVVGAQLDAGAVPTSAIRTGDRVDVLAAQRTTAGDTDATAAPAAAVLARGTVWSVESVGTNSASRWVSLLVPVDAQGAVAQAAADGLLRLSLVGGG